MNCAHCGYSLNTGTRFCTRCGTPVHGEPTPGASEGIPAPSHALPPGPRPSDQGQHGSGWSTPDDPNKVPAPTGVGVPGSTPNSQWAAPSAPSWGAEPTKFESPDATMIAPLPPPTSDGDWRQHTVDQPGTPGRHLPKPSAKTFALVAGLVALVGVGWLVARGLGGAGGGASSPEEAVRDLAAAINNEDPVGAAEVLAPDEVKTLTGLLGDIESRASKTGIGGPKKSLGGVDVNIENLELEVDELSDTVAKVEIRDGRAQWKIDPGNLGPTTNRAIGEIENRTGNIETDDLVVSGYNNRDGDEFEIDPFVIAVNRRGGWYVSPTYTVAAYITEASGRPAGDFDEEVPPDLQAAKTPEDAVIGLANSIDELDPDETLGFLPEYEFAFLHAYRDAIEEAIQEATDNGEGFTFDVDDSDLEVSNLPGGYKKVIIKESSGEASSTNEYGEESRVSWELDELCLSISGNGERERHCIADSDDDEAWSELVDTVGIKQPFVVVQESRGGWSVSPIATLAQYGKEILPKLSDAWIYRMLGMETAAEPQGTITINKPIDVTLNDAGFATYQITLEKGQRFTANVEDKEGGNSNNPRLCIKINEYCPGIWWVTTVDRGGTFPLVIWGKAHSTVQVRVMDVPVMDMPSDSHMTGEFGTRQAVEYRFQVADTGRYQLLENDAGPDSFANLTIIDEHGEACYDVSCELEDGTLYRVRIEGEGSYDVELVRGGQYTIDGVSSVSGQLDEYSEPSALHELEVDDGVTVEITLDSPIGADFDITCSPDCGSSSRSSSPESFSVTGPISGILGVTAFSGDGTYTLTIEED